MEKVRGPLEVIPKDHRSFAAFGHDLVVVIVAWCSAFWLRFNFDIPELYLTSMIDSLPWVVLLQGAIFLGLGLYRGIWRYASVPDLYRIVVAAGLAMMAVALGVFLTQAAHIPRSEIGRAHV